MRYFLIQHFKEPAETSRAYMFRLYPGDVQRVKDVINWLKEHAKDDWGITLPSWELTLDVQDQKFKLKYTKADEVIELLAKESRYFEGEVPGEFYHGTNHELDKHFRMEWDHE